MYRDEREAAIVKAEVLEKKLTEQEAKLKAQQEELSLLREQLSSRGGTTKPEPHHRNSFGTGLKARQWAVAALYFTLLFLTLVATCMDPV